MTNLITSLSNWLTTNHAIDLLGWQWIIFGGLGILVGLALFIAGILFFAKTIFEKTPILPW